MLAYILKRALVAVPTLLGVTVVTFILVKFIPGDPVRMRVGMRASPEAIRVQRERLGLDRPLPVQYWSYLRLLLKGDLGRSIYTGEPVFESILKKFPNTLRLAGAAVLFAVLLGVTTGILAAAREDSLADRLIGFLASLGISTPVFWFALLLIIVFANTLRWFPPSGMGDGRLAYLVLPALALGTRSAAYIARITRSSLLEVLTENFILTARAKGLSPFRVLLKHALKNGLIPVVTLIGVDLGSYLNGSVLTETIFGWDGLGRFLINGIFRRDYPVVLGGVLFGSFVFVVANLIVDLSYALLDPRVKYK